MSKSPSSPGVKLNPAESFSKMRRIIAEDPDWYLNIVPCLSDLCLQSIVSNFEGMLLVSKHQHSTHYFTNKDHASTDRQVY